MHHQYSSFGHHRSILSTVKLYISIFSNSSSFLGTLKKKKKLLRSCPCPLLSYLSVGFFIYERFFGLLFLVSFSWICCFTVVPFFYWREIICFLCGCKQKRKSSCGFVLFFITGKPHEENGVEITWLDIYVEWWSLLALMISTLVFPNVKYILFWVLII